MKRRMKTFYARLVKRKPNGRRYGTYTKIRARSRNEAAVKFSRLRHPGASVRFVR